VVLWFLLFFYLSFFFEVSVVSIEVVGSFASLTLKIIWSSFGLP
jgi:hypothetical protein